MHLLLQVHREGIAIADEDFNPTPIPLSDWHGAKKDGVAGTLQEVIATDVPPTVAAVPAHYWEDALRHSVYLTLVRDKIDQLIAKGSVITPDNKQEQHASREVDDHNLWEKIKTAPFDRLNIEEPAILGEITIMSKGRLLEERNGYRFTEDENSKKNCSDEKCLEGIKAFWSVKRVRQRDVETVPGKYHYELTFSVNSQTPQKHKKPYDNPVRTFTVREGTPIEQPRYTQPPQSYAPRPQRELWFHKNIVPTQYYQSRKNYQPQGLDRFFLSLFSSEEDRYDVPPIRHKPNPYTQKGYPGPPHSKIGYAGGQTEQHQHKKQNPYYYKHANKYTNPPLGPPPSVSQAERHYIDTDKLKIPFSPPQVQYHYPNANTKTKIPLLPPQVQQQNANSDKTKNQYPQTKQQYVDSNKTKDPYPQDQQQDQDINSDKTKDQYPEVQLQYTDFEKTIPFSQQVQHYLDDVKAKNPYPPQQTKYHYDVKSKVQPPTQVHNQQHYYREPDVNAKNPYAPQPDYKYQPSNVVKTTRPTILPTPPSQPLNITMEVTYKLNASEITTNVPEMVTIFKLYPKHPPQKVPPTKFNYFPEHVRPPVFNAPPGVFVTMDKKPFKPMPPLKHHQNHYPHSKTRPVNFRPSPQVVDKQLFSDPDPLSDAFRPMTMIYADNTTDSTETSEKDGSGKHKHNQHKNLHKSKPPKKHELIKLQRTTTSTPDIITAQSQSIEESDSMRWANNLLSAFVKTTPMVSQEAKHATESTPFEQTKAATEQTTTETLATTIELKKQEKTTTTPRPTKRTRPPLKFTKPEKVKKHKRVSTTTTTTTTSTTTTSTTERPRYKRPQTDLTPQASSAATGTTKSGWLLKSKIQNDTITTPMNINVTNATATSTSRPLTTTTKLTTTTPSPTPETHPPVATTQPKDKNRFRQSTLMTKGTSVNHDKWSMPIMENNKTRQSIGKYQQRRKGSNFQGYNSSTPKNVDNDHHKDHIDLAYNSNAIEISSTTDVLLEVIPATTEPTQPTEPQVHELDYPNGTEETEVETEDSNDSNDKGGEESKDDSEFIFGTQTESNSNEVITTPHATIKNKPKCKKKHIMSLTTTEDPILFNDSVKVAEIVTTTTEKASTETNIFAQTFGGYTVEGLPQNKTMEPLGEESEKTERFVEIDDDLEDFLDSLERKKYDNETNYDQYDEETEDNDYSPFNNEDEISLRERHADGSYDNDGHRSYSFLELMAME